MVGRMMMSRDAHSKFVVSEYSPSNIFQNLEIGNYDLIFNVKIFKVGAGVTSGHNVKGNNFRGTKMSLQIKEICKIEYIGFGWDIIRSICPHYQQSLENDLF